MVAVCLALLYALIAVVGRYQVSGTGAEYWVALFFEALWVSVCCRCCDSWLLQLCCCSGGGGGVVGGGGCGGGGCGS